MAKIRGAVTAERNYRRLVRLVAELEKDPKADPTTLANARKAIAAYEALPEHLR
jgi:hypothetical protein